MGGSINELTEKKRMDGWMDRQTDRQIDRYIDT